MPTATSSHATDKAAKPYAPGARFPWQPVVAALGMAYLIAAIVEAVSVLSSQF